ncbi:hypothetical protein BKA61DRAFT_708380 [Leptodontidium sp. MPI-SDFR-AT-0119]|nr:hypothetical protein BKA61DRAFT_708380 [Leptodontidium sp. MPI-SDFR-AT-0119]
MKVISAELIRTPASTQQTDSTPTTVPRMETPEADSLMSRFLTDTISNLTCSSPLPPNTPTRPKSMTPARNSSITAPSTKTRSSASLISQERKSEFSQQFQFETPSPKRHTSWNIERQESPCPDGLQKKGVWDHWSPGTKPRRGMESARGGPSKAYKSVGFGRLRPSEEDGEIFRDWKHSSGGDINKEVTQERKMETNRETKKENLKPKAIEPSPRKRKYPSLLSVAVAGHGLDTKEERKKLCYNCGKKGHWFVDCLVSCGHCKGNGHRTMDCSIVGAKSRGVGRTE